MTREKRVVSLVAAGCDILQALGSVHLLVGHAHAQCDADKLGGLEVCTEATTGDMPGRNISECEAAKLAMEALFWEAEFGAVGAPATLVEWVLSPHRVILPKLQQLKPDIIITEHQTSKVVSPTRVEAALEAFLGRKAKLIRLDMRSIKGIWEGIVVLMQEVGLNNESLLRATQNRIHVVQEMCRGRPKRRVLYLHWDSSSVLFHGSSSVGTWVLDAIDLVGGINPCLKEEDTKSTKSKSKFSTHFMDMDSISSLSPDILILANPQWGLKELCHKLLLHRQWVDYLHSTLPSSFHLVAVHGPSFLSRASPTLLVASIEALCEILHPECQSFGHKGYLWMTASQVLSEGVSFTSKSYPSMF